jgi:DNA-binding PucR family transcriptional regulator
MQKTGELMFLHKNTVKYRIRTIKELIGSDITKMPGFYDLYLAAAINRLRNELYFAKSAPK